MTDIELIQFANDRPTSLDDDLYQWATDAEELIRNTVRDKKPLITELLILKAKLRDLAVEHVELQRLLKNTTYKADHWFKVACDNNLVDDGQ